MRWWKERNSRTYNPKYGTTEFVSCPTKAAKFSLERIWESSRGFLDVAQGVNKTWKGSYFRSLGTLPSQFFCNQLLNNHSGSKAWLNTLKCGFGCPFWVRNSRVTGMRFWFKDPNLFHQARPNEKLSTCPRPMTPSGPIYEMRKLISYIWMQGEYCHLNIYIEVVFTFITSDIEAGGPML